MKALTLTPAEWAEIVVDGIKQVENRTWPTIHRGPLLIHAGKGTNRSEADYIRSRLGPDYRIEVNRGCIVGVVAVIGCHHSDNCPGRRACHEWGFDGQYHWMLTGARRLPPIPWRGQLGLFEVDKSEILHFLGEPGSPSGQLSFFAEER